MHEKFIISANLEERFIYSYVKLMTSLLAPDCRYLVETLEFDETKFPGNIIIYYFLIKHALSISEVKNIYIVIMFVSPPIWRKRPFFVFMYVHA